VVEQEVEAGVHRCGLDGVVIVQDEDDGQSVAWVGATLAVAPRRGIRKVGTRKGCPYREGGDVVDQRGHERFERGRLGRFERGKRGLAEHRMDRLQCHDDVAPEADGIVVPLVQ